MKSIGLRGRLRLRFKGDGMDSLERIDDRRLQAVLLVIVVARVRHQQPGHVH